MITYVSLCAFIACQGCGYSSSLPRRYAIRAAGAAGRGSVDLSPAEMSVPWWEDEQSWGHPAAWGGCPGGSRLGWEVGAALPQGEGLCWTWGPLPKNDALTRPGLSFGSGLEDVGLFCHALTGSWCVCAGQEAMEGCQGVFLGKCVFFFFKRTMTQPLSLLQYRHSSGVLRPEQR